MLPGAGGLSSSPVPADFLEPRDRPYTALESFEFGGSALQAPAVSRLVRVWVCFYEGGQIKVTAEDGGEPVTTLDTVPGVTTVSLAFDQNMNPTIAYMAGGVCKLRWFDSNVNDIVTTSYPGADSCQVTTDDKRDTQVPRSDVIFAYTRDGTLYYRQQRDRYGVEYTLGPTLGKLQRFGMNRKNRLQFELAEA